MNTKTLSPRALSVIDQYTHFSVGRAVCSVPYFNNKTVRAKAALRVRIGKGSPKDIHEEITGIMVKQHVSTEVIADESLKKLLTDNNIGIDCSGFAYYILNAESEERGKGTLDKHLSFVNVHGFLKKIYASLRPVENCDVETLANDKNSKAIALKDIQPGDIITMLGGPDNNDRNHILVVNQIDYQNLAPMTIHYAHAVAYPEDGIYGTGIKKGTIEIVYPDKSILEGKWDEGGNVETTARILNRAKISKTEIRRLYI